MSKRPRQIDVARAAGVSPATVSLVINNRVGGNVRITPQTRQRVMEAVDRLGYVADPAARRLAGGFNTLLGVFTFQPIFPLRHRDFYYPFLVGIESEAEKQGYDLLLFTSTGGPDRARHVYNHGVNRLRMADGSVLLGVAEDRSELERLVREEYPFVHVGRREAKAGPVAYVGADYRSATTEVVRHMLTHGHTRIAYVGAAQVTESLADRRAGYREAFEQSGLSPDPKLNLYIAAPDSLTPDWMLDLLQRGVTALVVESGPLASQFVRCIKVLGKKPPHDISFASLGDPYGDDELFPSVTTFHIPRQEMGAAAVRLLAQMLEEPEFTGASQIMLPCEFAPGDTVGRPPDPASPR
jgi:DNA-binding LacI/PurR family transcriptional regulator